jgi:uncharacterized protein (TIGR00725 family)
MPCATGSGSRLAVAVIGAGSADARLEALADRVGDLLAGAGVVVVCGGLGGVMEAACRGAHRHGGCTVGILPGSDRAAANADVDIVVPTGLGEARNVLVVRSGQAVIAIGGGYGTLSEIAFARTFAVPVFGLHTWRLPDDGVIHVATAEAAVQGALDAATSRGGVAETPRSQGPEAAQSHVRRDVRPAYDQKTASAVPDDPAAPVDRDGSDA